MSTLVIYYSYSGHTRTIAENLAADASSKLAEIRDYKRPGKLKAYSAGCFAAMRGKGWKIAPVDADLDAYDQFILLSPIWAGQTPPAVNAFLALLPKGKGVVVKFISGSGKSRCRERIAAMIKAAGCTPEGFEDIQA